jgi:hypothetical protein
MLTKARDIPKFFIIATGEVNQLVHNKLHLRLPEDLDQLSKADDTALTGERLCTSS